MYNIYKTAWPWATLKVQKSYIKINIKIGRGINTCKLKHGTSISEELLHSQGHLTQGYIECLKRLHKGQHQTWLKVWWGEDHYL